MPVIKLFSLSSNPPFLIQLYNTAAETQQTWCSLSARSLLGSSKKGLQRKTGQLHKGKRNLFFVICPFFLSVLPWQRPLVPVAVGSGFHFFPSLPESASLHSLRDASKAGRVPAYRPEAQFHRSLCCVLGHLMGDSHPPQRSESQLHGSLPPSYPRLIVIYYLCFSSVLPFHLWFLQNLFN